MATETFGKYEIRGKLGAGAMGTVYDAFDPVIERRAALKTVRRPEPGDAEGQEAMGRFKREAQAAGRLNHPHIVAVYDYGEDATTAWIAMELVEGGTLNDLLKRGEPFPLPQVIRVMEQVLAALDYSHKRGVVHRDIKPANIMLTADNQVKIADFGIARIENSAMTQVGDIMGTPAYMAPEQLRGEAVDSRADIWAAGVVLYQLLTGTKPFTGNYSAVHHNAIHTEPAPPSTLSVTAPRAFDGVIGRAMAKRPEDRFATAAAFADALRTAVTAQPPPPQEDATVVATATRRPPNPPAAAPPPPVKSGPPIAIIAGGGGLVAAAVAAFLFLGGPAPQPGGERPAQGSGGGAGIQAPGGNQGTNQGPAAGGPAGPVEPSLNGGSPSGPTADPSPTPTTGQPTGTGPATDPAGTGGGPRAEAGPPATQDRPPPITPTIAPPRTEQSPPIGPDGKPAPEPPRPVVVVAPPRIDFRVAAAAAAVAPACALLASSATDQGLALEGVLRRGQEATLRRVLTEWGVPAGAARISLRGFEGPYCDAFDTLRPVLAPPDAAPRLRLVGNMPLLAGQLLRFDVTMPDWPAQLTVSYFMINGEVAHLESATPHPPGTVVRLGEPRAGFPGWDVSEPFGTDLMLAITSETALFATPRPSVEPQQAYITALAEALRTARAAGRRVLLRPMVVETAAR